MRKRGFRAYDKQSNEWLELVEHDDGSKEWLHRRLNKTIPLFSRHISVMENTRVNDTSGRNIFEGDIIESYKNAPGTVVFNKGAYSVNNAIVRKLISPKIIGNIHDTYRKKIIKGEC